MAASCLPNLADYCHSRFVISIDSGKSHGNASLSGHSFWFPTRLARSSHRARLIHRLWTSRTEAANSEKSFSILPPPGCFTMKRVGFRFTDLFQLRPRWPRRRRHRGQRIWSRWLEALEPRQLLTVLSSSVAGTVLSVSGSGELTFGVDSDSNITVNGEILASGLPLTEIRVTGSPDQDVIDLHKLNAVFLPGLLQISVDGGDGADRISGAANIPNRISGGDGNDRINGGRVSDTLDGGAGNDTLLGSLGADTLTDLAGHLAKVFGSDGNDLIDVQGSDSSEIDAGAGRDTVLGTNGPDTVFGGMGRDSIETFAGADVISGGAGADTIQAGAGSDVVRGGAGNDSLFGQGGDDTMMGGSGCDLVHAGSGDDVMYGNGGIDNLRGGAGANIAPVSSRNLTLVSGSDAGQYQNGTLVNGDLVTDAVIVIRGTNGDDIVDASAVSPITAIVFHGKGGNDRFTGGGLANTVFGNAGNDTIIGAAGTELVAYGCVGDDVIRGSSLSDSLYGDAGNDFIEGGDGEDFIAGDAGEDSIYAGPGGDTVYGGNDNDVIYGNAGDDSIFGGGGQDTVRGGNGNDSLYGNSGRDRLIGDSGYDQTAYSLQNATLTDSPDKSGVIVEGDYVCVEMIRVNGYSFDDNIDASGITNPDFAILYIGGRGNDRFVGGAGNDTLRGSNGNDTLIGNGGDDVLLGTGDNDVLDGGSGNDFLDGDRDSISGGVGLDVLTGGDGDDTLIGGPGSDTIDGGAGNDVLSDLSDDDVLL